MFFVSGTIPRERFPVLPLSLLPLLSLRAAFLSLLSLRAATDIIVAGVTEYETGVPGHMSKYPGKEWVLEENVTATGVDPLRSSCPNPQVGCGRVVFFLFTGGAHARSPCPTDSG